LIYSFRTRLVSRVALFASIGILILPALATAQNSRTCGAGVTLKLTSPVSSQGSLLLVEVRSAVPINELKGEWNDRSVGFWSVGAAQKSGPPPVHRGLLGVDLEKPPGTYKLSVAVQIANGKRTSCTVSIPIRKGKFATENLHVEKQFVEPDPEQIKRANAERQRLRDIFATTTPEKLWQGSFRVPLDGVSTGGNFGKRRILNGQPGSPHGGVDFPATTGTLVHATQRGRVVLAEELFFSGNTVVLDHGLGIYTFYGHLSEITVKAGDDLEAGAVLGKVGATGRVTGAHLHWGLTVDGARVNPLQIVKLLGAE
jgi:murein DD-endopeptidase MepM/ murein hydrolase activator NlpD